MKRKIFIEGDAIATDRRSGVGRVALEVVRALADIAVEENFEIILVIPWGGKKFLSDLRLSKVTIKRLPPGYKYLNALLTQTPFPLWMDVFLGKGVYVFPNYKNWPLLFSKNITYVHDVAFKKYPHTVEPKNSGYLRRNIRRWLKRADVIITVSSTSAAELKECFPDYYQKVKYIYNGIDPEVFTPLASGDVRTIIEKHRLPSEYFLYVGNLEPRKNLTTLLDAYDIYCEHARSASVPLVIVGGGGWKDEGIKTKITMLQAKGLPVILPSNYIDDTELPAVIIQAKALVHVAVHEGFGLTPLEAMVLGTPVIISKIPVFKEIFGNKATYVDPLNANDIAVHLRKAGSRRIEPEIAEELKEKYSWPDSARALAKLIDTI